MWQQRDRGDKTDSQKERYTKKERQINRLKETETQGVINRETLKIQNREIEIETQTDIKITDIEAQKQRDCIKHMVKQRQRNIDQETEAETKIQRQRGGNIVRVTE